MYPLRVHVEEARRRGVALAAPCVHRSAVGWTWDGAALRCGLRQIRGLTGATLQAIVDERGRSPFSEVEEFVARTGASVPEAESLILSGALDDVGPGPRPARLWRLHCRARDGHPIARRRASSRLELPARGENGGWREFDLQTQVRHELETLDIAIAQHPVRVIRERLAREGRTPGRESVPQACNARGRRRSSECWPRRDAFAPSAASLMLFLTLEDESGLGECTLFPSVYDRFGAIVRGGWLLHATGKVEAPYGAPTLDRGASGRRGALRLRRRAPKTQRRRNRRTDCSSP